MTIGSGDLDRKLTIERFASTTNELNEQVKTWQAFISYRCKRSDLSDGERYASGQLGAFLIARFVLRSSADSRTVTPLDRLVHDSQVWEIRGVKEADLGRNPFIEITAATRSEP